MHSFLPKFNRLAIILLSAAALKLWLLWLDVIPFNADEAVVGLMARHILAGERPIFFYGQAYMGSLDAWLVAAGFWLLGQKVVVIRLVQIGLYLGTILTTAWLGAVALQSTVKGLLAAVFLTIPTVNMTLYTSVSLGGYGEALLIGNLILLVCVAILRRFEAEKNLADAAGRGVLGLVFVWGILAGLGLWANGLTLVYSFPSGMALGWMAAAGRRRGVFSARKVAAGGLFALAGVLIGSLPLIVYVFRFGWPRLVTELLGSAVAVETTPWGAQIVNHAINFVLLGMPVLFGFRPPWEVRWLGLPLLPFVMVFWMAVIVYWGKKIVSPGPSQQFYRLLAGAAATLAAGFIFTPFGIDPSGRYFLPLAVLLALAAGDMAATVAAARRWRLGLVSLVLVYNLWGTWQCASRFPPGLTTQFYLLTAIDHRYDEELIQFLKANGEKRGYTNYWVAYPLAFLSGEELVFVPALPYHIDLRYTTRDNRYPPYNQIVNESKRVAYITTRNPMLDEHLRAEFSRRGVSWQEKQIGDYQVFYRLSTDIRPEQIGLGSERP